MTKFVFVAVIAVLAFALYSIPSHSKDEPGAKGIQNPAGQAQDERKPARTAQKKTNKIVNPAETPKVPETPKASLPPQAPPAAMPTEAPKADIKQQ